MCVYNVIFIIFLLQLNVKDVHLRYEDDKTNPACPFACGLTIKKLSVHSTDSTWVSYHVNSTWVWYHVNSTGVGYVNSA